MSIQVVLKLCFVLFADRNKYFTPKMRFSELHKLTGDISVKMLTVTLRSLEEDGIVKRKIYPEIPPGVEYEITERGKSLMPHIHNLTSWAKENILAIIETRHQFSG